MQTLPDIALSPRRIGALLLRHLYLMRASWPRLLEMIYWPTVQMVLWGFITLFLATNSSYVAQSAGVLLSAVLLWDVLFRGQLGIALVFMEELYSRNLGHLFVSPLLTIRDGSITADDEPDTYHHRCRRRGTGRHPIFPL